MGIVADGERADEGASSLPDEGTEQTPRGLAAGGVFGARGVQVVRVVDRTAPRVSLPSSSTVGDSSEHRQQPGVVARDCPQGWDGLDRPAAADLHP